MIVDSSSKTAWQNMRLPMELYEILKTAPSVIIPKNKKELIEISKVIATIIINLKK